MTNKSSRLETAACILRVLGSRASLGTALLLAFCAGSTIAMASDPAWVRATNTGGNGSTFAYAIKVAPNNDQYVVGEFTLTTTFSSTSLTSLGGTDGFLSKYSPSGQLLWVIQAGGSEDDDARAVNLDTDGNVYITGAFTDSATFNSTDHTSKTVTGNGQTTYFAKYSSAGHLLWIQTGVSSVNGVNFGDGFAVNSVAHSIYITMGTQGNTTLSSADGTSTTISGPWTWHVLLAKYNTDGDFQWAQTNQGNPNSLPTDVRVDVKDNAYLVGWMEDQTTFTSANGHDITVTGFSPAQTTSDYPGDAFVAKYDKNGNVQWVNHVGGYKAIGSAVSVRPNGDVSMAGFIGNINYGSPSEAQTIVTSQPPRSNINLGGGDFTEPYNPDAFVATFNSAGVLKRAFRFGTSQNEVATSVAYNPAGSVLIAGLSGFASGSPNLFVRKYWNGGLVWQQTAQNLGLWFPNPLLSVDPTGRAFVSGGFSGTAQFGAFDLTASGSSDMFLAELSHE
jgi:hypothetical protein